MSFGTRLWDDDGFDAARTIPTARILLRRLDVLEASRTDQAAAVDHWLDDNRATPSLAKSLRAAGFGPLLDKHHASA